MINELIVKNYKSVLNATIPLSRLTVLIGENGAGKSNILESLVLAAAAAANKLDTEYLVARGVRLTASRLMKSAFDASTKYKPIDIRIETDNLVTKDKSRTFRFILTYDNNSEVSEWIIDPRSEFPMLNKANFLVGYWEKMYSTKPTIEELDEFKQLGELISQHIKKVESSKSLMKIKAKKKSNEVISTSVSLPVARVLGTLFGKLTFERFTVYNPNYDVLRNHLATPPTSPLGPKGEGLMSALATLQNKEPEQYKDVVDSLELFGWYKSMRLPSNERSSVEHDSNRFGILDRYIKSRGVELSELSVNEGFFFVLFYMTLVCSNGTPPMFAIENIETALNPRLCEVVVKRLYSLAKKYNKQIILTTHSPSVLDALNLDDPEQSLVIIRRNTAGHTCATKFKKPAAIENMPPVRLSEAFLRGHIGALPRGI